MPRRENYTLETFIVIIIKYYGRRDHQSSKLSCETLVEGPSVKVLLLENVYRATQYMPACTCYVHTYSIKIRKNYISDHDIIKCNAPTILSINFLSLGNHY